MTLSFSSACILPRPATAYKKELRVKDRDEKSVPVQELIQFRNMFFHGSSIRSVSCSVLPILSSCGGAMTKSFPSFSL